MTLPASRVVLYADDESSDRFLMAEAWKQAAISRRIVAVEDGEQAVEYLEGRGRFEDRAKSPPPGLVILDINMPRKSGFEVLQWMRTPENRRCQGLPVIILSASARPRDIASAYGLGASAYVTKPSTAGELIKLASAIDAFWLKFAEFPAGDPPGA